MIEKKMLRVVRRCTRVARASYVPRPAAIATYDANDEAKQTNTSDVNANKADKKDKDPKPLVERDVISVFLDGFGF